MMHGESFKIFKEDFFKIQLWLFVCPFLIFFFVEMSSFYDE
jgi:hypothetical protein